MNVRLIGMHGFGSYREPTYVELPERGLVVVQGPNGSGKSSLIEAVAVAYWGRSLRGPALWQEDGAANVCVRSDLARAERERAKGRTHLRWEMLDPADLAIARLSGQVLGDEPEHETTTKAQQRLERIVGTFDVWRRTSVLSSADAAHFALATDAERKTLLEEVLGLDRFDPALAACRADLKESTARRERLERDTEVAVANLESARDASARADEVLRAVAPPEPEAAAEERSARLAGAARANADMLREARAGLSEVGLAASSALAAVRQAEQGARRFAAGDCPTCGQGVRHLHERAVVDLAAAERAAEQARSAAEEERRALSAQVADLEEERDDLARAQADLRARTEATRRAADVHRAALKAADHARAALEGWQAKHAAARAALAAHADDSAELELCEQVLGMRGVRATMLDRALAAVERHANAWLRRLAFPGTIRLGSTTEQRSGRVVDAISLEVEGAGGGKYRGSSGGERRRVDIALLLGLAEVAAAARGGRRGTIFADELFDALDGEGIEAASAALADLAADRTVVVITHSEELASRLPAALRLRVEAGAVVRGG